jgi:hypothetical protein
MIENARDDVRLPPLNPEYLSRCSMESLTELVCRYNEFTLARPLVAYEDEARNMLHAEVDRRNGAKKVEETEFRAMKLPHGRVQLATFFECREFEATFTEHPDYGFLIDGEDLCIYLHQDQVDEFMNAHGVHTAWGDVRLLARGFGYGKLQQEVIL